MPKDLSFLWSADLSMPIKSAVLEMFPWCFFNCVVKYSFSKYSLASFNGDWNDCFKISSLSFILDEGFKMSSINWLIFCWKRWPGNDMGHETLEILVRERHVSRNHINPCTKTTWVAKCYFCYAKRARQLIGAWGAVSGRKARLLNPLPILEVRGLLLL